MARSSTVRTKIELAVVLALSLGASAIYSLVSIIARLTDDTPLAQQTATINRQLADREWLDFVLQFFGIAFGLAPVALVLFLMWERGNLPQKAIGLDLTQPNQDLRRGLWLAGGIGIPGLGLYLFARELGISAEVIPASLEEYWWTVPMLLFAALKASLLEEIVVVAYLFDRLSRLGFSKNSQIWISASLRATYHLYQGLGGFIGNLTMGLVFGWLYQKWGRVMPLVVAHFVLDAAIFVGYATLKDYLSFL